jgi:hypothetical protein
MSEKCLVEKAGDILPIHATQRRQHGALGYSARGLPIHRSLGLRGNEACFPRISASVANGMEEANDARPLPCPIFQVRR